MHPENRAERHRAFERLWQRGAAAEVALMPPRHQGRIHDLLEKAFNAGSNWEHRKHEPVSMGGCD